MGYQNEADLLEPFSTEASATITDFPKQHSDFHIQPSQIHRSIKCDVDYLNYIVETLLTFHSFLKYGAHLLNTDNGIMKYQQALELLKRQLVMCVQRSELTVNWKLQKMLELSHFLDDILEYGPASGFNTNTGERGLKQWAKSPAQTSQKRDDSTFVSQLCQRINEQKLLQSIVESDHRNNIPKNEVSSAQQVLGGHQLYLYPQEGCAELVSPSKHNCTHFFPRELSSWFLKHYKNKRDSVVINIFTEYRSLRLNSAPLIQGHWNFNQKGSWYDFVLLKYLIDNDTTESFPARVICFYNCPDNPGRVMAVVQEVLYQSSEQVTRSTQIFKHWRLDARLHQNGRECVACLTAVDVSMIQDRIYGIDLKPWMSLTRESREDFDVLIVKYLKEQWPQVFLDSPEYFHRYVSN